MEDKYLISDSFIQKLFQLAKKDAACEETNYFCAMECSGGNYDDAYSMGRDDGEIFTAREFLTELGLWK